MSYTVHWVPKAERELADIWAAAEDRKLVTEAANRIDDTLHARPEELGESRGADLRIVLDFPLGVTFQVRPAEQLVFVLNVWQIPRRRQKG
jgi:hypothetical protein